nr:restriction endonuclease subunit S [Oceanipulchritudo coccoides]
MLFITSENVRDGFLDISRPKFLPVEFNKKLKRTQLRVNDILINLVGASIGRSCKVADDLGISNVNQAVAVFRMKEADRVAFTALYFQAPDTIHRILEMQVDAARPNISLRDLRDFSIPLPPINEQARISTILSTCDEAIEVTDDLIKAKQRQKKALMQQLLTGKKRLPGFEGEWTETILDDLCTRLKDVADDPEGYPVLSITAGTGFVSQQDKFSRVIAGKQVENYVVLKRGEFAYNKGNSYRYPQGCVYQLSEYDEGLVPNVFYSFRLDEEQADPDFIKQYFLAGLHNKNLYRWINSGVRNNGLLNLNASDFFKLSIDLPPLPEQKAIGRVLCEADTEIKTLGEKLNALKQQKKALMQKLLTGQVRVKV